LFSWVVPTLADRDLSFQDLHVLSGWGPCPCWVNQALVTGRWTTGRSPR